MVTGKNVACENIRFCLLFAAGDFSRRGTSSSVRNVPSGEELGETDFFSQASKNENSQKGYQDPLYMISAMFLGVVMHLYILGLT